MHIYLLLSLHYICNNSDEPKTRVIRVLKPKSPKVVSVKSLKVVESYPLRYCESVKNFSMRITLVIVLIGAAVKNIEF